MKSNGTTSFNEPVWWSGTGQNLLTAPVEPPLVNSRLPSSQSSSSDTICDESSQAPFYEEELDSSRNRHASDVSFGKSFGERIDKLKPKCSSFTFGTVKCWQPNTEPVILNEGSFHMKVQSDASSVFVTQRKHAEPIRQQAEDKRPETADKQPRVETIVSGCLNATQKVQDMKKSAPEETPVPYRYTPIPRNPAAVCHGRKRPFLFGPVPDIRKREEPPVQRRLVSVSESSTMASSTEKQNSRRPAMPRTNVFAYDPESRASFLLSRIKKVHWNRNVESSENAFQNECVSWPNHRARDLRCPIEGSRFRTITFHLTEDRNNNNISNSYKTITSFVSEELAVQCAKIADQYLTVNNSEEKKRLHADLNSLLMKNVFMMMEDPSLRFIPPLPTLTTVKVVKAVPSLPVATPWLSLEEGEYLCWKHQCEAEKDETERKDFASLISFRQELKTGYKLTPCSSKVRGTVALALDQRCGSSSTSSEDRHTECHPQRQSSSSTVCEGDDESFSLADCCCIQWIPAEQLDTMSLSRRQDSVVSDVTCESLCDECSSGRLQDFASPKQFKLYEVEVDSVSRIFAEEVIESFDCSNIKTAPRLFEVETIDLNNQVGRQTTGNKRPPRMIEVEVSVDQIPGASKRQPRFLGNVDELFLDNRPAIFVNKCHLVIDSSTGEVFIAKQLSKSSDCILDASAQRKLDEMRHVTNDHEMVDREFIEGRNVGMLISV